jgi:hypothetical protein
MKTLAIGFGLVLVAASASAQSATDSRWTPWLGCWDLVIENARDGSPAADVPRPQRGSSPRGDLRPRVCVERADAGATFRTTIGDRTPIVQTIVADGTARPITDTDCTGTQSAEWSRDGLRMFSRAELTCKCDAGSRRVSGLGILGANGTWIDVQSIVIDGRDTYRVRRYRRQDPAAPSDARQPGRALTLDDVKEASAKVTPHALEAALVETNASFVSEALRCRANGTRRCRPRPARDRSARSGLVRLPTLVGRLRAVLAVLRSLLVVLLLAVRVSLSGLQPVLQLRRRLRDPRSWCRWRRWAKPPERVGTRRRRPWLYTREATRD